MIAFLLSVLHDPMINAGVVSIATAIIMHFGLDVASAAVLAKVAAAALFGWAGGLLAKSPITPAVPAPVPATKTHNEGD